MQPPEMESMPAPYPTLAQPIAESARSNNQPGEHLRQPPASPRVPFAPLAEFILGNMQSILAEWDVFARSI